MVFLSIVVPAFNEQDRLPRTLEQIVNYLAGCGRAASTEILVVNDGSSDRTAAVVEAYRESHPNVELLNNPGNRGKGYSVRHGMLKARGEWVLFTDADLSAPIEEVEKLFGAIEKNAADVAIGSRALNRSLIGVHQSRFRENAGRLFNVLMRMFVGLPFWDTQCGFKLFRREAARETFSRMTIEGFGFDVESLFIARKLGFKIEEVPVRWDHAEGTKVNLVGDSLGMFVDLARVRWNDLTGKYARPSYSECDTD